MFKGQLFEKVPCHMLNVKKQDLVHTLLGSENIIFPNTIDKFICAEIPDPDWNPLLYDIVKANMIDEPCGILNNSSPCMKDGCCTKRYLSLLFQDSQRGEDGYPKPRSQSPVVDGFRVKTNQ